MKRLIVTGLFSLFSSFALQANSEVNCRSVEFWGNLGSWLIVDQANASLSGRKISLGNGLELVFNGIEGLEFDQCKAVSGAGFSLSVLNYGPWEGSIELESTVTRYNSEEICLGDTTVTGIDFEGGIPQYRQRVYKYLLNLVVPDERCFER